MNSSQNNLLPRIYEQSQTVFSMAGLSMTDGRCQKKSQQNEE